MRICVFGDSILLGAFDQELGGWVERLKLHFWQKKDFETDVDNYGISGDKVGGILHRIESQASFKEPDKIILAIGINDSSHDSNPQGTPLEEFRKQYNQVLDKAEKFTRDILIIGPTNIDEEIEETGYKNEEIKKYNYNQVINDIARKRNLPFVDVFGILTKENLSIDGLHPDANGHKKVFKKILQKISN